MAVALCISLLLILLSVDSVLRYRREGTPMGARPVVFQIGLYAGALIIPVVLIAGRYWPSIAAAAVMTLVVVLAVCFWKS
jgi:hypothetical protein